MILIGGKNLDNIILMSDENYNQKKFEKIKKLKLIGNNEEFLDFECSLGTIELICQKILECMDENS